MSTKTREELQAEYQKRLRAGLGYVGSFDSGLTNAHRVADSVAAILAELATQRQPVGDKPCGCSPDGSCDACHERVMPAPAPVGAVTTELDDWLASVRGDWMPSGADDDCLRAAKADQLAARAQDQARIAELEHELAKAQSASVDMMLERDQARAELATVRTDTEGVWRWQGDGHDEPESLTCPVVMSADKVREFATAARELARLRELAKSGTSNAKEGAEWRRLLGLASDKPSEEVERG
jgi:hypothetical protein